MSPLNKMLLGLLTAVMVWILTATWGSIGSAVMAFGLISLVSALLYQRFLNRDDSGDYSDFQ